MLDVSNTQGHASAALPRFLFQMYADQAGRSGLFGAREVTAMDHHCATTLDGTVPRGTVQFYCYVKT